MEDDENYRPPHRSVSLSRVVYESCPKIALGVGLIYASMSPTDDPVDYSPTDYVKFGGREAGTMLGIQCCMSAFYDISSCLYESWRSYSIELKIKKLKGEKSSILTQKKKTLPKQEKRAQALDNTINALSRINPREEFVNYANYLNYSTDILQTIYMMSFMCEGHYNYSIFPEYTYRFDPENWSDMAKSNVSLVGTTANLMTCLWSLRNFRKQWSGELINQDVPLHSFFRSISNRSSLKFIEDSMLQKTIILAKKALAAQEKGDNRLVDNFNILPHRTLCYVTRGSSYLQCGNGIYHFFEGCKKLYDERNYWLSLVDDLIEDKDMSPVLESSVAPIPASSKKEKSTLELDTIPVNIASSPETGPVTKISLEGKPQEQDSHDASLPKNQKNKRRGVPNQNKTPVTFPKHHPSNTLISSDFINERNQTRKAKLAEIQEMRLSNSVPKGNIESLYTKAAKFSEGIIKENGNKITISWMRGLKSRSVTFELTHKQRNEKASIVKGYKLTKVLDAVEQIYLDGWDKKNILSHLNGRFKLYNLPYELFKVLWLEQEEK